MENDALQVKFFRDMMETEEVRKKVSEVMKNEVLKNYNFPTKPSSDGYYHIYVSDDTKKNGRRQIKAKTLEELKEKVYNYELSGNGGVKNTFKEVFELVMAEKTKYINDPEKLASVKNTILRRQTDFKRFFGGTDFEKMAISSITVENIENIVFEILTKYKLRFVAFSLMQTILRQTFSYALRNNLIYENIFNRVDFSRYRAMVYEDVPISQRAFSDEDLKFFLDFLHDLQIKQPSYIPAYALELQILTGLRRGEIPPLMWSDVIDGYLFIHRQQITVEKSGNVSRHFEIVEHTKTHKDRRFPIDSKLNDFLRRLKAVHDEYYPNNIYLFPANTHNGNISNDVVYEFFRDMLDLLGYKYSDGVTLGTHSFRRNAITRIVNASGGNLVLTAEMFGNSPQIIRKNYFTGIDMDMALAAVEKSNNLL